MDIAKIVAAAVQLKATEARVEVGEPTQLIIGGEVRTLFASTVKADDFERNIIQRLDAFKRDQLRSAGQCKWQFEEKGIGKIEAEVELRSARFFLPRSSPAPVEPKDPPVESKRGFLSKLFGGK